MFVFHLVLPLFGHITVVRKQISCILLLISCNRCLVAKGERVKDIFAEKDCWNKLLYFGFSRRLVRYFWLKFFFVGTQDMGLQLSSLELSLQKSSSWAFGPPNTEILGWQIHHFMCIMGFSLAFDCLRASGSPPCGCVVCPQLTLGPRDGSRDRAQVYSSVEALHIVVVCL